MTKIDVHCARKQSRTGLKQMLWDNDSQIGKKINQKSFLEFYVSIDSRIFIRQIILSNIFIDWRYKFIKILNEKTRITGISISRKILYIIILVCLSISKSKIIKRFGYNLKKKNRHQITLKWSVTNIFISASSFLFYRKEKKKQKQTNNNNPHTILTRSKSIYQNIIQ